MTTRTVIAMFNMSMRIKRMEMILGGQLIFHDAM